MSTPRYGSDHVIDGWLLPNNDARTHARDAQVNAFVIAGFNRDETGALPETNWAPVAARNAERAKQTPPPPGSAPQPPIGLAGWSPKTEQVMQLGDRFQPIPRAKPAKVSSWKRFYATQPAG